MKPAIKYRARFRRRMAAGARRHTAAMPTPFFQGRQKRGEGESTHDAQRTPRVAVGSETPFFENYVMKLASRGKPLEAGKRDFFERKLGVSLDGIRVHDDHEARRASRDIGAKAFTWKNHVVVNPDWLTAGPDAGQRLLGHELLHAARHRDSGLVLMKAEEDAVPANDAMSDRKEQEAEKEEERMMQPESLPDFSTYGKPSVRTVFGKSITVTGRTDRTFDGGSGTTKNLKGSPAKNCAGCDDCWSITGSLVLTYSVTTTVTLPDVPDGLTKCQQQRVREVIDGKIAPHEQEHVAAFNTYNGTVTLPISYTGCKDGLEAHVQKMHDDHAVAREAAAQAKSDALDPYVVPIDLDCEDK
ncbi:MAG: DUF4157 domain-containing protein [Bacteroidia bacterium]|nr:DUF4157 domain-containing protein [Bacteroidia bacterium]